MRCIKKTYEKTIISAAAAFVLIFSSCKKEDNKNCSTLDTNGLIGTYRITAATVTTGSSTADVLNDPQYFSPCSRDDVYVLGANGVLTINDAGVVCSPSNSGTSQWAVMSTSLEMDGDFYTVENYSCSGMDLVQSGVVNGVLMTFRVRMTRQ